MDTDLLPPTAAQMVAVIGLEAVLALVEACGGARVYVPQPQALGVDHTLVRALGLDAAERLAAHYGGDAITVPRCLAALRGARNRAIRERHAGGARPPSLARRFGLTERQVYAILAAGEPTVDERQASLF